MDERQNRWVQVGALLKARYKALDMSQADFVRVSTISDTLVRQIERGQVEGAGPRSTTRHKLEDAARWERGSIDRILEGGDPVPLPTPPVVDDAPPSTVLEQIAAIRREMTALSDRVAAVERPPRRAVRKALREPLDPRARRRR